MAPMSADGGLSIRDVYRRFGATPVLNGVSLHAPAGRITALVGQNGAGKSTLFKIAIGLVRADRGEVRLFGRDISRLPVHQRGRCGLGFLPQDSASFPELTVRENLTALLEFQPLNRSARRARVAELLSLLRIEEIADRPYRVLSGGEQRRVEIAKALSGSPRVLLLDEPFSGLDPSIIEEVTTTLRDLTGRGVGILMTDHTVHMVLPIADHVFVLAGGTIVREGDPATISTDEWTRSNYLGRSFPWR